MKNIIIAATVLILIVGGVYYLVQSTNDTAIPYEADRPSSTTTYSPTTTPEEETDVVPAEIADEDEPTTRGVITEIGTSVEGRPIVAYHFGTGENELLLIGGIHGGYSWNTALLAYELMEWLTTEETVIPENVTVTIIPTLNPDGLYAITNTVGTFTKTDVKGTTAERIAARFNANTVDLNRNFDCEWEQSGTWQNQTVSGGTAPFSEPEARALREYVNTHEPTQVVAWYSAAGGVYASQCGEETLRATRELTNRFATAAGYTAHEEFDYYAITGDMVNWFAKQEIPAISVLLTTHEQTEFNKNKAGVEALLSALAE